MQRRAVEFDRQVLDGGFGAGGDIGGGDAGGPRDAFHVDRDVAPRDFIEGGLVAGLAVGMEQAADVGGGAAVDQAAPDDAAVPAG